MSVMLMLFLFVRLVVGGPSSSIAKEEEEEEEGDHSEENVIQFIHANSNYDFRRTNCSLFEL